jgi:hypothetical protein
VIGLIDVMTVYTQDAVTGRYTVVDETAVPCRLAHFRSQPGASGVERAELAATRNLIWTPGYVMPEGAQIDVGGVRWNTVVGTYKAMRGPSGAVTYRQCDALRAIDG